MADQRLGLVIEDDPSLSEIFSYALQFVNVRAKRFTAGDEALAWLSDDSQEVPDVILLDLQLPQISGDAILRYIRKTERLAKVKVLILTAHARLADIIREDADVVLVKPIRLDELQTMVTRLVGQAEAEDTAKPVPEAKKAEAAPLAKPAKKETKAAPPAETEKKVTKAVPAPKPEKKTTTTPTIAETVSTEKKTAPALKKAKTKVEPKAKPAQPAQSESVIKPKIKPAITDSIKPSKSDLLKGKPKPQKSDAKTDQPEKPEQKT